MQTKLKIGKPGDRYEQEADRIADQVMRMPHTPVRPARTRVMEDVLRTKRPDGASQPAVALQAQFHGTRCPGSSLSQTTRDFFEPRLGHDFSDVKVHTCDDAVQMASSLNAKAFTLGNNIYFNRESYNPHSSEGKNLLAHELTHVVQQRANVIAKDEIRRRIYVNPPGRGDEIAGYLNYLCKAGNFSATKGVITGNCTPGAGKDSPSCDCVCDTVSDQSRLYSIQVVSMTNQPRFQNLYGCRNLVKRVPYPNVSPQTYGPAGKASIKYIIMPTASGNTIRFGAFQLSGEPFYYENWRILAHELCGHAKDGFPNGGPTGNRPGHDDTIKVENQIASEHGHVARGLYGDPRQGESFHYPIDDSAYKDAPGLCDPRNDINRVFFRQRDGKHYEQPYPYPLPEHQECTLDHFRFDRSDLTTEQRVKLRNIAVHTKALRSESQWNGGWVFSTGHTDAPGIEEYNYNLGMRRANRVRYGLNYYCVPYGEITSISKGEKELKNPTLGPDPENRRVVTDYLMYG